MLHALLKHLADIVADRICKGRIRPQHLRNGRTELLLIGSLLDPYRSKSPMCPLSIVARKTCFSVSPAVFRLTCTLYSPELVILR